MGVYARVPVACGHSTKTRVEPVENKFGEETEKEKNAEKITGKKLRSKKLLLSMEGVSTPETRRLQSFYRVQEDAFAHSETSSNYRWNTIRLSSLGGNASVGELLLGGDCMTIFFVAENDVVFGAATALTEAYAEPI